MKSVLRCVRQRSARVEEVGRMDLTPQRKINSRTEKHLEVMVHSLNKDEPQKHSPHSSLPLPYGNTNRAGYLYPHQRFFSGENQARK